MTNLLPEEYKNKIHREYRLRYYAVISLFVFFAIGISVFVLVPNAFTAGTEYFLARQAETQIINPEDEKRVKDMNAELLLFRETLGVLDPKKEVTPVLLSEMMRLVAMQKPAQVSLESFGFVSETEAVKKILLSGLAENRESLVAFSKRLTENKTFTKVDLPISNLSKKQDIEFSITLTIGEEKKAEEKKEASEE
jgi:hypothetical protein